MANPEIGIKAIIETLQSRIDWPGNFSVIEENRIRLRPLIVQS
jgi:hypothetical protein